MKGKTVKELMLPLDEYAVVRETATLLEALQALEEAQAKLPPGREHHRAVLVADKNGSIVGKIGHHGFLQALEPKYNSLGDVNRLSRAGVSPEFMNLMMENLSFWQDDNHALCQRARTVRVNEVMHPAEESIDEDASLTVAVNRLIFWQSLSVLVTRGDEVVGILRMSDLFAEIVKLVKGPECASD